MKVHTFVIIRMILALWNWYIQYLAKFWEESRRNSPRWWLPYIRISSVGAHEWMVLLRRIGNESGTRRLRPCWEIMTDRWSAFTDWERSFPLSQTGTLPILSKFFKTAISTLCQWLTYRLERAYLGMNLAVSTSQDIIPYQNYFILYGTSI